MSVFSSKSIKERQGFTPYQSDLSFNSNELSLLSRLNLNGPEDKQEDRWSRKIINSSFECFSYSSKKRKLSQEILNSSNQGGNTFLNRSLVGKSSLNHESFVNSHELSMMNSQIDKNDRSENSCPVILGKEESEENFFSPNVQQRPRFTKTKNLLRNISSYLHKFILHNRKGQIWVQQYLKKKYQSKNKKHEFIRSEYSQEKMQKRKDSESDDFFTSRNDQIEQQLNEQIMKLKIQTTVRKESKQLLRSEEESSQQQQSQFISREKKQFFTWIQTLNISNFSDYQAIWTNEHKYRGIYRFLCYKYYKNEAICDIYGSRLTTKHISASYLYQFIEGLLDPSQFNRFK